MADMRWRFSKRASCLQHSWWSPGQTDRKHGVVLVTGKAIRGGLGASPSQRLALSGMSPTPAWKSLLRSPNPSSRTSLLGKAAGRPNANSNCPSSSTCGDERRRRPRRGAFFLAAKPLRRRNPAMARTSAFIPRRHNIVRDQVRGELGAVDVPPTRDGAHSEIRRFLRTDAGRQER